MLQPLFLTRSLNVEDMKSRAPGDLSLPITMLPNSLADLPVPLSIVPASTRFNYVINGRPFG
jgi:hypothetical protein